jgi:hypothetical protein
MLPPALLDGVPLEPYGLPLLPPLIPSLQAASASMPETAIATNTLRIFIRSSFGDGENDAAIARSPGKPEAALALPN